MADADASLKTAGDEDTNDDASAAATSKGDINDGNRSSGSTSEDFVIFGSRPSHLFDDIALAIDSLLTDEVASLPLLPRTLTESERRQAAAAAGGQKNDDPRTGEEKLIAKLRKAYKRNLDLAEAYCSRNIFTVQYHTKTMRRKILENYLAQDEELDGTDSCGKSSCEHTPLPDITFAPPEGELPSPDQIVGMDREILVARQRLQRAKQRRVRLRRQLDRLAEASRTLSGVREALRNRLERNKDGGGERSAALEKLRKSVTVAMKGHEELKGWNSRAEEMLQILDKIKVEREEGDKSAVKTSDGNGKKVVGREEDQRMRKRMWAEVGDGADRYGSREQVATLLKKLRGV